MIYRKMCTPKDHTHTTTPTPPADLTRQGATKHHGRRTLRTTRGQQHARSHSCVAECSPLRCYPLRDSNRADPSRLRAHDIALPSLPLVDEAVQHELRYLRRLSAPRLAAKNHYLRVQSQGAVTRKQRWGQIDWIFVGMYACTNR